MEGMTTRGERAPELDDWWMHYRHEYDSRTWADYRHLLAEVIRYATEPPLLDVGCGYGFLLECARRFGIPAVGVEASELAIAECRARHPSVDVRQWTAAASLPFDSCSVGVAMLNQVIDHFTATENRHL